MSRRPLIAGNWKMYLSIDEAVQLASSIASSCQGIDDRDVMLAPANFFTQAVSDSVQGSPVIVAGQNVCWESEGAFTGEISPVMLKAAGASMVILGHSERRHIFHESDELVNKRLLGALRFDLVPILCVGEKLDEREDERTFGCLSNSSERV